MNIVLIGMMGSGKSTVGRIAARKMGRRFFDADSIIADSAGQTVDALFETRGEFYFRKLEQKTLRRLARRSNAVIAAGGGAACFEQNWKTFRRNRCLVVWLRVKPEELYRRLKKPQKTVRPLLKEKKFSLANIRGILSKRDRWYNKADLIMENSSASKSADAIVSTVRLLKP